MITGKEIKRRKRKGRVGEGRKGIRRKADEVKGMGGRGLEERERKLREGYKIYYYVVRKDSMV